MCLKSGSSPSYFLLYFLLLFPAEYVPRRGFPWTPSWESAVALLALQRWARSHICSPWQGSRPVRPPRPPPLSPPPARASVVLSWAFCACWNNKAGHGSVFHPRAELRPCLLLPQALFHTRPSISKLSINIRLIKHSTSKATIPLRWSAVTDSSGWLGFLTCSLFLLMALPVSQAEWKLCLDSNWPGCRDKLSP